MKKKEYFTYFVLLLIVIFLFILLMIVSHYRSHTGNPLPVIPEVPSRVIDESEKVEKSEQEFSSFFETVKNDSTLFRSCIDFNQALNNEEKEVAYSIVTMLNDVTLPSARKKEICRNIYYLDVLYQSNMSNSITGYYENHVIYLNSSTLENRFFSVLGHELLHAISENGNKIGFYDKQSDFGYSFNEGMTQLLAEEYFGDVPGASYPEEVLFMKLFLELSSSSFGFMSYLSGDIDSMINQLLLENKSLTKGEVIAYIEAIDNWKNEKITLSEVLEQYQIIYQKIYHRDPLNDKIIRAYFSLLGEPIEEKYEINKYYFNSFLKQENPNAHLITKRKVLENGNYHWKIVEETITNKNRFLNE